MFCSDFLPYKSFMKINKDQLNKEKKKNSASPAASFTQRRTNGRRREKTNRIMQDTGFIPADRLITYLRGAIIHGSGDYHEARAP